MVFWEEQIHWLVPAFTVASGMIVTVLTSEAAGHVPLFVDVRVKIIVGWLLSVRLNV